MDVSSVQPVVVSVCEKVSVVWVWEDVERAGKEASSNRVVEKRTSPRCWDAHCTDKQKKGKQTRRSERGGERGGRTQLVIALLLNNVE